MGSSVILPAMGQPKEGADPSFVSASQPTAVSFITKDLPPPSAIYLQRDDVLHVLVMNSFAGLQLAVNGRFLLPAGTTLGQPLQPDAPRVAAAQITTPLLIPFTQTFLPTSDRSQNFFALTLTEGFLLGLRVLALGVGPKRGQTFVHVSIARGPVVTPFTTQTIMADYLVDNIGLGWPGGRIIQSTEGPGWMRSVAVANPAAGADFLTFVPNGARWRVVGAHMILTTSATVANRVSRSRFNDGANDYFDGPPNQVIPASQTASITWTPSPTSAGANVPDVMVDLSDTIIATGGDGVGTSTENIQAGDQYSAIDLRVEEWIEQ